MKRYGMILAFFLVLAVNAFVLASVAYNRWGQPNSQVVLTEKELRLPYHLWRFERENTGIWLNLDWHRYDYILPEQGSQDPYAWFDRTVLESVGFACTLSAENPRASEYYYRMLPRRVYAVLEIGGKTWEVWKSVQEKELASLEEERKTGNTAEKGFSEKKDSLERKIKNGSRLFVVHVGKDPESLRLLYPDRSRCIITPALVGIRVVPFSGESNNKARMRLQGYVKEILIDRIHVPLSMGIPLKTFLGDEGKRAEEKERPHYMVTLRYGKRYEPWIVDIKLSKE